MAEANVQAFSTIEDVEAIYIGTSEDGLTVWVFIRGEEYNDSLMDRLLAEEVGLISRFPDQAMVFRYVPSARRSPHRDIVGRESTLVYQRPPHG